MWSRATKVWLTALVAFVLIGAKPVDQANAATVDERKAAGVMAAYLRYIAVLTTWPEETQTDSKQPMLFGMVGDDPNGVVKAIRARAESKKGLIAQGRPIDVVDLLTSASGASDVLGSCALLFLSEGAHSEWADIQAAVSVLPIVTVSEMKGFAASGGMIEYFVDLGTGTVRMIVNLQAMREAGIQFSARLLNLDAVILLEDNEDD